MALKINVEKFSYPLVYAGRALPSVFFLILICSAVASAQECQKLNEDARPRCDAVTCKPLTGPQPLTQTIKPGETYCYRVAARQKGEYLLISVRQSKVKVYTTLCGPERRGLMKLFQPFGTNDVEPVHIVTSGPGEYTITVEALADINKEPGEVYVTLAARRPASARDQTLFDAEVSFAKAEKLRDRDEPASQTCAVQAYLKALAGFKSAGDLRGEAQTRNYLAYSLAQLEKYKDALSYLLPASTIWARLKDAGGGAQALNNEASIYMRTGDAGKAENAYKEARRLYRQSEDYESEAVALSNLGGLYLQVGRPEDARNAYQDGLEALSKVSKPLDPTLKSNLLKEMGLYYFAKKDLDNAEKKFCEALALLRDSRADVLRASILNSIAAIHITKDEPSKAFPYLDEAIDLYHRAGKLANEAIVLSNYGSLYMRVQSIRDLGKAVDYFRRAMEVFDNLEAPYQSSRTLFNWAKAEVLRGHFAESKIHIEEAINMLESLRLRAGQTENRQAMFAQSHFYYDFYVNLLMELHSKNPSSGFDVEALRGAERSRGRTLIDLLSASSPAFTADLSAEEVQLIKDAETKLAQAYKRRRHAFSADRPEQERVAADEELRRSVQDYESLERRWSRRSTTLLFQLRTPSLPEIRELLDEETVALEFAVLDDHTFVWAISKDGPLFSTKLPIGRQAVAKAAEELREKLTARNCVKRNETEAQKNKRIKDADEAYKPVAAELSRVLLDPFKSVIGGKRLAIVADGALQVIPFAALPAPAEATQRAGGGASPRPRLLVEDHEIVYLPSLTTLARARQLREGGVTAGRPIAIFADPVFSSDDERLATAKAAQRGGRQVLRKETGGLSPENSAALKVRELTRSSSCLPIEQGFERLPGTLVEANGIIDALKPRRGAELFKDFNASLPTLKQTDLTQFRVIHLASHAYVPSSNPEQARIMLSLYDAHGREQPGALDLSAIHKLRLNADLVTLSACETGVGQDVAGEGVIGLARGFMYAGTPRVTASLWKVRDDATAEFMSKFYRQIFAGDRSAAAALRQAQLDMSEGTSNSEWNAPFYWAAFVLEGDWR